jgi:beta-glucosidase
MDADGGTMNSLRLLNGSRAKRTLASALAVVSLWNVTALAQGKQPQLGSRSVPTITVDGLRFRDLNRDGKLEPFEDWRLPPQQRADDLVARMSLEEKAGLMMHASAPSANSAIGMGKAYDVAKVGEMIADKKVVTFITRLSAPAADLATQDNLLQEQAEKSRFAVPLTISTDPRNNFNATLGASNNAATFSQWPDMTGMAAINDAATTYHFADIARQEYLAVGIQMALSPQADLATEPRWSRIDGTFGEDPQVAKSMVEAYISGFQNGETGLHPGSVLCVVKHWVGYGAMKDGLDGHNSYSRHAVFPGHAFDQHLIPFEGAFKAKVAAVMPTYAVLDGVTIDGKPLEPVAAGFNKQLLTDLLRDKYHFNGIVLSDWLITEDCKGECLNGSAPGVPPSITPGAFGMSWGVENLTPDQRYIKALDAGIDQFGGVADSDLIVQAVHDGKVSEGRIDLSAKRLLIQKFELGLFENPYVDPAAASAVVGRAEFKQAALLAQEQSMVLLTNKKQTLPLRSGRKVYLVGVDANAAKQAGLVPVATAAEAEFAIVRLNAPHQMLHPGYFFGSRQHEGDLDFKADDPQFIAYEATAKQVPTIAAIYLDRPAILTQIVGSASAVLANFGSSDEALLAIVTGSAKPKGKLPFELPRSMDAVRAQKSDVPHDSTAPLFPVFSGLSYP